MYTNLSNKYDISICTGQVYWWVLGGSPLQVAIITLYFKLLGTSYLFMDSFLHEIKKSEPHKYHIVSNNSLIFIVIWIGMAFIDSCVWIFGP